MQEFSVPQFIDIEDKIIGAITTRQFITLLAGGSIIFLLYRFVTFNFFIFLALGIGALTGLFAFVRINGQPFHLFLVNALHTFERPPLRVWRKEVEMVQYEKKKERHVVEAVPRRMLPTPSKISELALMVDTGGIYKGEE